MYDPSLRQFAGLLLLSGQHKRITLSFEGRNVRLDRLFANNNYAQEFSLELEKYFIKIEIPLCVHRGDCLVRHLEARFIQDKKGLIVNLTEEFCTPVGQCCNKFLVDETDVYLVWISIITLMFPNCLLKGEVDACRQTALSGIVPEGAEIVMTRKQLSEILNDEGNAVDKKLTNEIEQHLKSLGGAVPKLNWSVPQDAVKVTGLNLVCKTAQEIYDLFRCSDAIAFDYERAYEQCIDACSNCYPKTFSLILRKYDDGFDAGCILSYFWFGSRVVGIRVKQTGHPICFDDNKFRDRARRSVEEFHSAKLYPKMKDILQRGVTDVLYQYCLSNKYSLRLWDISPWGGWTDPGHDWSWSELTEALGNNKPPFKFRYITVSQQIDRCITLPEEIKGLW